MKLTKEQIAEIEQKLKFPYNSVTFLCDGYQVTLAVELYKPLKYSVMTYVNGSFTGEWFDANKQFPEQKFLRFVSKPLYTPAQIKQFENIFGKRQVAKDERYKKKICTYTPIWRTGKSALTHLCKVCDSIELVEQ